jgi:hypothetical protein
MVVQFHSLMIHAHVIDLEINEVIEQKSRCERQISRLTKSERAPCCEPAYLRIDKVNTYVSLSMGASLIPLKNSNIKSWNTTTSTGLGCNPD